MRHIQATSFRALAVTFAVAAGLVAMVSTPGDAQQAAPTAEEVEAARRCALETKEAGRAFGSVRDNLQVGGGTRAAELLSAAEDALLDARSACRGNAELSAILEDLSGEAERIRRSLGAPAR